VDGHQREDGVAEERQQKDAKREYDFEAQWTNPTLACLASGHIFAWGKLPGRSGQIRAELSRSSAVIDMA
jgi:hypothetical protein